MSQRYIINETFDKKFIGVFFEKFFNVSKRS